MMKFGANEFPKRIFFRSEVELNCSPGRNRYTIPHTSPSQPHDSITILMAFNFQPLDATLASCETPGRTKQFVVS